MCGIVGLVDKSLRSEVILTSVVSVMSSALEHRGPDSSGLWTDFSQNIAFGHRRLKINDLSDAGKQPMKSVSGRYQIVFNGEIYNFRELRKELEDAVAPKPIHWNGSSDTEVLLMAIDFWGIDSSLKKLVGMFSFAIWDVYSRQITLVRDRFGEKPLYYGYQDGVFIFASELKALRNYPGFRYKISKYALAEYVRLGYVPGALSIFEDIYKVPLGSTLTISKADIESGLSPQIASYWSTDELSNHTPTMTTARIEGQDLVLDSLDEMLRSVVEREMVADVPLGIFLSGGTDSSLIASVAQSISDVPISTFSIGFEQGNYNEAHYAKEIAKYIGSEHQELYVGEKELLEVVPMLTLIYDEPFSDSSQIPMILLSKLARQRVTVVLSGDGADELFLGYNRHLAAHRWQTHLHAVPLAVRKTFSKVLGLNIVQKLVYSLTRFFGPIGGVSAKLAKVSKALSAANLTDLYRQTVEKWPVDEILSKPVLDSLRDMPLSGVCIQNLEDMARQDIATYLSDGVLVKVDRASMATSLEVRAPFLDHTLANFSGNLPMHWKIRDGEGKWILKRLLTRYLPMALTARPKMGFSVPIDEWLRGPLRMWAEELLSETRIKSENFFDYSVIRRRWDEHLSGKNDWSECLWTVLMFQDWLEKQDDLIH